MGIDGYTLDKVPISVKQSERVGRNIVDNFETAIKRDKKDKGIIVGYSFTKGAYNEAKREYDIELIEAKKIAESPIDGDELFKKD